MLGGDPRQGVDGGLAHRAVRRGEQDEAGASRLESGDAGPRADAGAGPAPRARKPGGEQDDGQQHCGQGQRGRRRAARRQQDGRERDGDGGAEVGDGERRPDAGVGERAEAAAGLAGEPTLHVQDARAEDRQQQRRGGQAGPRRREQQRDAGELPGGDPEGQRAARQPAVVDARGEQRPAVTTRELGACSAGQEHDQRGREEGGERNVRHPMGGGLSHSGRTESSLRLGGYSPGVGSAAARVRAYGSFGERSSDSDSRERVTSASIASARCSWAML